MLFEVLKSTMSSVVTPFVVKKHPLPQKSQPKERFFNCGNSRYTLCDERPFIST